MEVGSDWRYLSNDPISTCAPVRTPFLRYKDQSIECVKVNSVVGEERDPAGVGVTNTVVSLSELLQEATLRSKVDERKLRFSFLVYASFLSSSI